MTPRSSPHSHDVSAAEHAALLARAQEHPLTAEDVATLRHVFDTLTFMTQELQRKSASVTRPRRLLFGPSTEKAKTVLPANPASPPATSPSAPTANETTSAESAAMEDESPVNAEENASPPKPKQPGHGRTGLSAYTGATHVPVPHATVHSGDRCRRCGRGKIYPMNERAHLVRITGMAPLSAQVFDCERLRCNTCGEVQTAAAPEGVGEEKYDAGAKSMVGLLKYGTGLPFNRIETLQAGMGIPLPAATQWDLVHDASEALAPAHEELIRQAAQGDVVHNDDTTMKVLEISKEEREAALGDSKRKGTFTSGIVSVGGGHTIALFFTGVKHAGENLAEVLKRRAQDLSPPIQMCDPLPANTDGDFETIVANCNAHARRNFVDVASAFTAECGRVLEDFRQVFAFEAETKKQGLSAEERLRFHQEKSGPVMHALRQWAQAQLDEKRVEPNSGLGDALQYPIDHWEKLTCFLRVPGALLDNNLCERVLKKAILHRKNAYFYRTLNGARVGDAFMSLIHTCELNGANPFDYLVALQQHAEQVRTTPGEWMPWNYTAARERPTSQLTAAERH